MTVRKQIAAVVGVLGLAAAGLVVTTTDPAQAVDGKVRARVYTGEHSGGVARSYLVFMGKNSVDFTNFVVNDLCPPDGRRTKGRAVIRLMDGAIGRGPWYYDDGGCDSPAFKWSFGMGDGQGRRIKAAWVTVCVGKKCAPSRHRDNPHTG